ncbi:Cyclin-dependent kinase inhibitor 5 [Sesamum alatum]|uniref:Cyclin-dependent kinase inhibitor 5 n=1 Tax=Sesamum alatum TaxID=300844 RepID=A0AAE1Y7V0_9LAMI|nr:Cyclin-dependent kinase inhibitor 5 [Sesamum alatum]
MHNHQLVYVRGPKPWPSRNPSLILSSWRNIMDNNGDDGGYLQLRSRRLKRHVPPLAKKAKKKKCTPTKDKKEIASLKIEEDEVKEKDEEQLEIGEKSKNGDYNEDEEGSYGDNELDFENKDRITRETTPSTLIEGSNIINTPTSSNKSATNVNAIKKLQTEDPVMPSPEELEAFLSRLEKQNIDRFIKEYNFDPVNEKPLEGRYEWVEFTP